jgi:hypothetical protein
MNADPACMRPTVAGLSVSRNLALYRFTYIQLVPLLSAHQLCRLLWLRLDGFWCDA